MKLAKRYTSSGNESARYSPSMASRPNNINPYAIRLIENDLDMR
jgi:hypothetical protein